MVVQTAGALAVIPLVGMVNDNNLGSEKSIMKHSGFLCIRC